MNLPFKQMKASHWRQVIQWLFLGWCLFLGLQFGLFVRHFETRGAMSYVPRPPGVEGFLPIGSLVSLKTWVMTGHFDTIHPAALVLFLTFVAMALLAKKSFCSFLCPVGTLSEGAWKVGQRLFGRNRRIWPWLDITLLFIKYALLFFFVKLILVDMPAFALREFLAAPYWAIADVKMLYFFTRMSGLAMTVILVLTLLSVVYRNFWCRYLCPYGALLGLFSMLSPFKVSRRNATCTGCGTCSRVCPSRIDVQHKARVHSPECTGCLTCVSRCPEPATLQMSFWSRPVPGVVFISVVVLLFAVGVLSGMLSGHWQTSLVYADYQQLIPQAWRFGH